MKPHEAFFLLEDIYSLLLYIKKYEADKAQGKPISRARIRRRGRDSFADVKAKIKFITGHPRFQNLISECQIDFEVPKTECMLSVTIGKLLALLQPVTYVLVTWAHNEQRKEKQMSKQTPHSPSHIMTIFAPLFKHLEQWGEENGMKITSHLISGTSKDVIEIHCDEEVLAPGLGIEEDKEDTK